MQLKTLTNQFATCNVRRNALQPPLALTADRPVPFSFSVRCFRPVVFPACIGSHVPSLCVRSPFSYKTSVVLYKREWCGRCGPYSNCIQDDRHVMWSMLTGSEVACTCLYMHSAVDVSLSNRMWYIGYGLYNTYLCRKLQSMLMYRLPTVQDSHDVKDTMAC